MNWIKVGPNPADNDAHPERLPPLDKVVWIIFVNRYNDERVFALGGRSDVGDGWVWCVNDSRFYTKDQQHSDLIDDDDYIVTHWAGIEWPE
jgi:hypothetical protein